MWHRTATWQHAWWLVLFYTCSMSNYMNQNTWMVGCIQQLMLLKPIKFRGLSVISYLHMNDLSVVLFMLCVDFLFILLLASLFAFCFYFHLSLNTNCILYIHLFSFMSVVTCSKFYLPLCLCVSLCLKTFWLPSSVCGAQLKAQIFKNTSQIHSFFF